MKRLLLILATLLLCSSAWAATKVQVMTDGKIDVDKLPTIDFSLETDPASPEDGRIWWNETEKLLKIADPSGVYTFNGTLAAWDTTPAAFSFTDVTNATTNSTYTSAAITVSGINHPAAISVSGDASAKYSVNNATATATNGTVESGDEVRAVVTSSASDATAVNATVTIGGVSDVFSVTTAAGEEPVACEGSFASGDNESWEKGEDQACTSGWVGLDAAGLDTQSGGWSVCGSSSLELSTAGLHVDLGSSPTTKYIRFYIKSVSYSSIENQTLFYAGKYNNGGGVAFRVATSQYTSGSQLRTIFLRTASNSSVFLVPFGSELRVEVKINDTGSSVDGTMRLWRNNSGTYEAVEVHGESGVYEVSITGTADSFRYLYFLPTGNGMYFDDIQLGNDWVGASECE